MKIEVKSEVISTWKTDSRPEKICMLGNTVNLPYEFQASLAKSWFQANLTKSFIQIKPGCTLSHWRNTQTLLMINVSIVLGSQLFSIIKKLNTWFAQQRYSTVYETIFNKKEVAHWEARIRGTYNLEHPQHPRNACSLYWSWLYNLRYCM